VLSAAKLSGIANRNATAGIMGYAATDLLPRRSASHPLLQMPATPPKNVIALKKYERCCRVESGSASARASAVGAHRTQSGALEPCPLTPEQREAVTAVLDVFVFQVNDRVRVFRDGTPALIEQARVKYGGAFVESVLMLEPEMLDWSRAKKKSAELMWCCVVW